MVLARLEEVANFDEEGVIDGLQFDCKERRLQEWREKKEAEEFKKLVTRLQARNRYHRDKHDPEKLEKLRARQLRFQQFGKKYERQRELRREKFKADPVVNACQQCGKVTEVPFEQRGKRSSKYCSKKCKNKATWRDYKPEGGKGLRTFGLSDRILEYLGEVESATTREITEALGAKVNSVRTRCCNLVKSGELKSDGGRPAVYSLGQSKSIAD